MPRYVPYNYISPVYSALQDTGAGVQQGLEKLADANYKRSDQDLKSARTRHELALTEMGIPVLKQKAKEAQIYLDQQDELDQPINTKEIMGTIFGPNPSDTSLNHFFENNIHGSMMKVGNLSYDPEKDLYTKNKSGETLTRRDFFKFQPIVQGQIVAKTDPVYKLEDAFKNAKAKGDVKAIAEIQKVLSDPNKKWMLDKYDQQEQYLLNYKGTLKRYGLDPTTVDDDIKRIERKRSEILQMIKLDKELKAKGEGLKPEITQKDIAELSMKANELVDKRMKELAEQGKFENWSQAQLDGYRRQLSTEYVQDALRHANFLKGDKGGTGGTITASDLLRQRGEAGKKPDQEGSSFDAVMGKVKEIFGGGSKPADKGAPKPPMRHFDDVEPDAGPAPSSEPPAPSLSERLKKSKEAAAAAADKEQSEKVVSEAPSNEEVGGWLRGLFEKTRQSIEEANAKSKKDYDEQEKVRKQREQDRKGKKKPAATPGRVTPQNE